LQQKRAANAKLVGALKPLKQLARVWSGAVMTGEPGSDLSYGEVAKAVSEGKPLLNGAPTQELIDTASDAIAYDLVFPEVFHPSGEVERVGGFDAVVSNPPWDALQPKAKEFFAAFDLAVLRCAGAARACECREAGEGGSRSRRIVQWLRIPV
jgi:hypothetical protein